MIYALLYTARGKDEATFLFLGPTHLHSLAFLYISKYFDLFFLDRTEEKLKWSSSFFVCAAKRHLMKLIKRATLAVRNPLSYTLL